jgi:hypothetical protein
LISTSSSNVSLYFILVGGDGGGNIAKSTAELISPAGFASGSFLQEQKIITIVLMKILFIYLTKVIDIALLVHLKNGKTSIIVLWWFQVVVSFANAELYYNNSELNVSLSV